MKKNQKGFTLVELLAVIVILAIILIIAVPSITNIIDNAQKDSLESSARVASSEALKSFLTNSTYGEFYFQDGQEYNINGDKLLLDNNNIESGYLLISNKGETALAFYDGQYCAIKNSDSEDILVIEVPSSECKTYSINPGFGLDTNGDGIIDNTENDYIVLGKNGVETENEVTSSAIEQEFHTVAYVNYLDPTPSNLSYTIDLDHLEIPFEDITSAEVIASSTMITEYDFSQYILKKRMGYVSFPSGADSIPLESDVYLYKDHSVQSDNVTINDVSIDCTLKCTATIDVTVNNLNLVDSDVIEGGVEVAYVPTKFTIRFNGAETNLDSKSYYSVGYVSANDTFPKTISYTIDLGNTTLEPSSVSTANVTMTSAMNDEIDYQRYIVKKNLNDVSLPDTLNENLEMEMADQFYNHSLDSNNMTVDNVVVNCSSICQATITVTINNINDAVSINQNGNNILYMGTMFDVELTDAVYLTGYDNRIAMTIDHNLIDEDLTYFPVTVNLDSTNAGNFFTELGSNKLKVAFTDVTNTKQLYGEIEYYNEIEQKATYHVSNSDFVISSTEDTKIFLYYDIDASDNWYVNTVNDAMSQLAWNPDYTLVNHMATDLSGSSGQYSASVNNGTTVVDGVNGEARSFNGTGEYISIGGGFPADPSNLTIAISLKRNGDGQSNTEVILDREVSDGSPSTGGLILFNNSSDLYPNLRIRGTSNDNDTLIANSALNNEFKTLIYRYDGSYIYEDEKNYTTSQSTAVSLYDSCIDLRIGASTTDTTNNFNGEIDELRISKVVRSNAWTKAEILAINNELLEY